MKFNTEFSLCEVAGRSFLVPTGSEVMDVDKMMDLNETSLFIINELKSSDLSHEQLLARILEEYDIDEQTAATDLSEFVTKAKMVGVILP